MLTGNEEGSKCRKGEIGADLSRGAETLRSGREAVNLDVDVFLAPEKVDSRQPILLLDCLASQRPVLGRQYPCRGGEVRTGDFASDGAGSDPYLGIIPEALEFPGVVAGHHIKLVVLFSKPDWRRHCGTTLAESG